MLYALIRAIHLKTETSSLCYTTASMASSTRELILYCPWETFLLEVYTLWGFNTCQAGEMSCNDITQKTENVLAIPPTYNCHYVVITSIMEKAAVHFEVNGRFMQHDHG